MDLRVRKTYNALIAACTKLLSQKRFEEITVAMLCEEAMIRRTTFYKHFADKTEFFSFYVGSLRTEMVERGRSLVSTSLPAGSNAPTMLDERKAILTQLTDYLLEHESLMDNIFTSSMSGMMLIVVCEKIAEAFRMRAMQDLPECAPEPIDLLLRCEFAAGGVVRGLLLWWEDPQRREKKQAFVHRSAELAGRLIDE